MAKKKYKIIANGTTCQVIDVDTGEDIARQLSSVTLALEPGSHKLELHYIDFNPIVEVDCSVDVTSLTDKITICKGCHPPDSPSERIKFREYT